MGHFLRRLTRSGQDPTGEFEFGGAWILGLLAAPGAFTCFLLLFKYSSLVNWMRGVTHIDVYLASLPDKFLFLSISMAVTGIVTVLKWDQLLPDSQDYLNLVPLPIRPRTIFFANAIAIIAAVVVVSVTVNGLPSILFPLFATASVHMSLGETARFAVTHLLCVSLAGVFSVCAVCALLGTLSAVLPRHVFRASSSWIRGVLLLSFVILLMASFDPDDILRILRRAPHSAMQWLPSLWYLGMYQGLQHHATPSLARVAAYAWPGVAYAFALTAVSYGLSYRRRFAEVLEGGRRPSSEWLLRAALAVLDAFAPRAQGFGRASHRFVVRALVRSESHRLIMAVSIGLGWLLAAQAELMRASLIASYFLILGLRLAFDIPAGVPANWIFRTILDPKENEGAAVAHRVILTFLVPCVLLPSLVMAWWRLGAPYAAVHVLYVLALSWCVMEVQLAAYRKLPLTCPMPGFRDNFLMLCLLQLLGLIFFMMGGAAMERRMFQNPVLFLLVPAAMLYARYWNRRRLADAREAGELEEGLVFDNPPVRAVQLLNISGGA